MELSVGMMPMVIVFTLSIPMELSVGMMPMVIVFTLSILMELSVGMTDANGNQIEKPNDI